MGRSKKLVISRIPINLSVAWAASVGFNSLVS